MRRRRGRNSQAKGREPDNTLESHSVGAEEAAPMGLSFRHKDRDVPFTRYVSFVFPDSRKEECSYGKENAPV